MSPLATGCKMSCKGAAINVSAVSSSMKSARCCMTSAVNAPQNNSFPDSNVQPWAASPPAQLRTPSTPTPAVYFQSPFSQAELTSPTRMPSPHKRTRSSNAAAPPSAPPSFLSAAPDGVHMSPISSPRLQSCAREPAHHTRRLGLLRPAAGPMNAFERTHADDGVSAVCSNSMTACVRSRGVCLVQPYGTVRRSRPPASGRRCGGTSRGWRPSTMSSAAPTPALRRAACPAPLPCGAAQHRPRRWRGMRRRSDALGVTPLPSRRRGEARVVTISWPKSS